MRARAHEILSAALDVPPSGRAAFVAAERGGDEPLRAMVADLLSRLDRLDGFMEDAPALAAELGRVEAAVPGPGERIGNWVVVRELGRGGMGVILLVERADGAVRQSAALKIILDGAASEAALARFHGERQILANLQHSDIARLIDAGSTADGRPYFVMEYC
ncbi:hypothetical protein C7C56_008505 [Massilia glaciei]|uniref:Protein kinase domain-containing protein n=1 Tax=Massilia glaciei TaxID=1524097 RepID=A0A2U2HNM4_9BURK|nr:protein kinase [Massilia glaciei]PWF49079.1 hypothetical protein C7C56_008505 [Massilia glaciei]